MLFPSSNVSQKISGRIQCLDPLIKGASVITYQVSLIGGSLQFLVDPNLGLVTVTLKSLELVGLCQPDPTGR